MTIPRWFIGLANGSGGDGADAALVEVGGVGLQLKARVVMHVRRSHPREVQDFLTGLLMGKVAGSSGDLSVERRQLGESDSAAIQHLLMQSRFDPSRVLALGAIGSLAWHEPNGRTPSSFEVGQPSIVAERTGLTVFSDFRERDIAAGGQGMPITALADWVMFRDPTESRWLVHLGGVTSLVYLPAGGRPQDVIAFEVGPGTRLLDAIIRQGSAGKERFDQGGKHAVQGRCLDALLENWLKHPFLERRPPKSLPRSEFGAEWITRSASAVAEVGGTLEDFLCTISHFLVKCVSLAKRWLPANVAQPKSVWLSGGGTRNGLFWRLLEHEWPGIELRRVDELGVPIQARQAAGAAVLAAMAMDGIPASSPGITGAVGRLLGRVTPGEPRNWARCLRWMAEQSVPELTHPYRAA